MPLPMFGSDPAYAALQALPGMRRRRLWMPPGNPAPPTAFLTDTFTDTNAVLLESHTGELGATWAKHGGWTGSGVIQSNRIFPGNGIEAHYNSSGVPGGIAPADYDVTVNIFDMSNLDLTLAGAMGRMVIGADTGYAAFVILSGGITYLILKRHLSGTGTDLTNTTITTPTVGTTHTLTLRMAGSALSLLWDGVLTLGPITDTNIAAAGRAGIINNGVGSSTTGFHIDSISAITAV